MGRRWELGRRWRLGVQLDVFGSPKLSGTFQTGGWFSDSYGVTGRVLNTNLELAITYN
ncbi:MAG: hypothetical protein KC766_20605 [Myxococcales bacterium]|nr:hypothetical protein [Myxococcales bacterium]